MAQTFTHNLLHPRHWLTWSGLGLLWLLVQLPYLVRCVPDIVIRTLRVTLLSDSGYALKRTFQKLAVFNNKRIIEQETNVFSTTKPRLGR